MNQDNNKKQQTNQIDTMEGKDLNIQEEDLKAVKEAEQLIEGFNVIPPEAKKIVLRSMGVSVSKEFSGPLPAPEDLAGYENCYPGSADRIITMAEKEQDHRFSQDKKVLSAYEKIENKGMNFSFFVTMSFLAAGVFIVCSGKDVQGFALLSPVIIQFFVHIFKNFKDSNKKNNENNSNNELKDLD